MSTGTFPALKRRPARVLPSVLVSVIGIALAVTVLWVAAERITQGQWPQWISAPAHTIGQTPSTAPPVLVVGIVCMVIGLVVMASSLIPGRFNRAQLKVEEHLYTGAEDTVLTHRGLAHILEGPVSRVDGVRSVKADVTSRKVRLRIQTPLRQNARIKTEAVDVAEAALRKLPLVKHPKVSVSIQHKKG